MAEELYLLARMMKDELMTDYKCHPTYVKHTSINDK